MRRRSSSIPRGCSRRAPTSATSRASTSSPTSRRPTTSAGATPRRRVHRHAVTAAICNAPGSQGLARVPDPKPKRFSVSYHLLRLSQDPVRVRVQAWLDDGEEIDTVVPVWPTADWFEREAWDMFGIRFRGHPNLVRILMEDDWEGHPLRKDYPVGGEPVRFSGEEYSVSIEPCPSSTHDEIYEGSRIPSPIPTVLQVDPDAARARRHPHRQLRAQPPVHARRAAPRRRPRRRARRGHRGRDRLPAHGLREDDGAEDVVEVHHLPGADRLRRRSRSTARLRARDREAARDRGAARRRRGCACASPR